MAIPPDVTKVALQGTLSSGEVFATGFWFEGNAATTFTEANTQANVIASYFDQYLDDALLPLISVDQSYDSVSLYSYPSGGPAALVTAEYPILAGTGTGTGALPLQSSLVITTQTDFIGRSRRGRIYVPVTAKPLATNHQLTLVDITAIVNAWDTFLTNVRGNAVLGTPVVVSQVGVGSTAAITALRADSRIDIQRRRAAKQDAAYTYRVTV